MTTNRNSNRSSKVIVGMSGGVDSSVAALLLQQQGFQVEGLFMKNWEEDDGTEYCTARQDFADAQAVADTLGIRLHGANFAAEYWDNVFEHFLAEYKAGRTPNPDILCNREIKFKAFLDYAMLLDADFIATGHYSRLGYSDGKATLLKGLDCNKDQSYFLHAVAHSELYKIAVPGRRDRKTSGEGIGPYAWPRHSQKRDSTGICFIGERRFRDFLQQYLPAQPGEIHSLDGEILGTHQGLMYHTIGQRQGLGIGGLAEHNEMPWYVVDKDLVNNVLSVVQGNDHPALFKTQLFARDIYWVAGEEPPLPLRCAAKIRYRQQDQPCLLTNANEHGYRVAFDEPQRAITPGQSVVFYQGDRCLGGGVIERTAP
ncbi:MAG: tRNA 2-thiouridine(34) synthase MnmA [Halioglobus sp.]